jgi:DNA-binding GntR family transcriptional regulator
MRVEAAPPEILEFNAARPGQTRVLRLHDLIREDIVEGRLEPGARLKTAELAERYGTSTNPVREALHQLQGEGIVVISPNRGARVRPVGEEFVRNIYEIRH